MMKPLDMILSADDPFGNAWIIEQIEKMNRRKQKDAGVPLYVPVPEYHPEETYDPTRRDSNVPPGEERGSVIIEL